MEHWYALPKDLPVQSWKLYTFSGYSAMYLGFDGLERDMLHFFALF